MPSPPPRAGYYGPFGGRFVPETLVPALDELAQACDTIVKSDAFQREWRGLLAATWCNRVGSWRISSATIRSSAAFVMSIY